MSEQNDSLVGRDSACEAAATGVRGSVSNQVADLLTNPREHNAAMTSSSALEAIAKANQVLPYIDMTQAFMENPDPSYQRVQTFRPEKQQNPNPNDRENPPGRRPPQPRK